MELATLHAKYYKQAHQGTLEIATRPYTKLPVCFNFLGAKGNSNDQDKKCPFSQGLR